MKELQILKINAIVSDDEHLMTILRRNLDLIICVDKNYSHIQQLESLQLLFEGGLGDYYKEHQPKQQFIVEQCAILAKNTFWNRYAKDDKKEYDVYQAFEHIVKKDLTVKDFKSNG